LFILAVLKIKAKTVSKERKDREINTESFILVHSLPKATSNPQQPLRIHQAIKKNLDYTHNTPKW